MIDHAALLMERIHDCPDDWQTDAAATVFSGSRFIHFVKFDPDIVHIFFRYRISRVKNTDADFVPFLYTADIDPLFSILFLSLK